MDRINGAGHVDHQFVTESYDPPRPPTEITDVFLNNVQEELVNLATNEGQEELQPGNQAQAIQMIKSLIAAAEGVKARSILTLPSEDIGPIIVIEASEVWTWVETSYYEGYRSPLCGAPISGHTITPLAHEVDAVGGVVSKAAYARLWAYAQENGLVVSQAVWAANLGAHWFVDVDGSNFRLPDLRNQFIRLAAGAPDLDTANVRALGSHKMDKFQDHGHQFSISSGVSAGELFANNYFGSMGGNGANLGKPAPANLHNTLLVNLPIATTAGTPRFGQETAPRHTAMYPRIHA